MTSQGQRFRRRALRRGYKVDEVDTFLDRVEGTLGGDPIGAPITAQEVHDVQFRVRFGGYDEWQVDLHLDRVERQLAELEERGGTFARGPESRVAGGRAAVPSERKPMAERTTPNAGLGAPERTLPSRDERTAAAGPTPMPTRPQAVVPAPGRVGQGSPSAGPPRDIASGRPVESAYGAEPAPGLEAGRRGRADVTAERRLRDEPTYDIPTPAGPSPGRPGPGGGPGFGAAPGFGTAPGFGGGPSFGGPGMGGGAASDAQRIDQLRRTFQVRRFGSGYDPAQVDGLFDKLAAALTGRGPMPESDAELDRSQFDLVPGGYFEAEVDDALKEVRDIVRRR